MKMQLGDMEMDTESGISYGDDDSTDSEANNSTQNDDSTTQPAEQSDTQLPERRQYEDGELDADSDIIRWAHSTPALFQAASGLGTVAFAVGLYLFLTAGQAIFGIVATLGAMWAVGGRMVLDWADEVGDNRTEDDLTERERQLEQYSDELRAFLADSPGAWKAEEIQQELGWSKRQTLNGLAYGVERGKIREDLDVDSEHWVYTASTADLGDESVPEYTLPASERAEKMQTTSPETITNNTTSESST